MENNLFDHYCSYAAVPNENYMVMKSYTGNCKYLAQQHKALLKTFITVSKEFFIYKPGDRMVNPFLTSWKGLLQTRREDTIIVVFSPSCQLVELFISEKTKSSADMILEQIDSAEIQKMFHELRICATDILY